MFLEACLKGVYNFAHQILIAEGSCPQARFSARTDGRSSDNTVDLIKNFPDPDGKITLVASRAWNHKDDMCNAIVPHITGDILWQLDLDEFYHPEDIDLVLSIMEETPDFTAAYFPVYHFWHGFDTVTCEGHWETPFKRIHRFGRGSFWLSHEPPVLADVNGIPWESKGRTINFGDYGVWLHHYSYVTEEQARWKAQFFLNYVPNAPTEEESDRVGMTRDWFERVWLAWESDPKGVEERYGTTPGIRAGKTKPFTGEHPPVIREHSLYKQLRGL